MDNVQQSSGLSSPLEVRTDVPDASGQVVERRFGPLLGILWMAFIVGTVGGGVAAMIAASIMR